MTVDNQSNFVKAERVVDTMLGLLERDVALPQLVWQDAAGDFAGAKGDTITIRLPAYTKADKRALRSGATKNKSELFERTVNVTLDTDLYKVIPITDEQLTLDISSFTRQVSAPVLEALVRGVEEELIAEITGEDTDYEYDLTLNEEKPHLTILKARRHLNDARVPKTGRSLIVGSGVEETILSADQFVKADQSGSTGTFRDAAIGRIYGFTVFPIDGLPPEEAYAFHRTAYVLNSRAPRVPDGVAWGRSASRGGFAMRVAKQVDPDELVDNFHADVWTGTNHVTDHGVFDEDGKFEPSEDPNDPSDDEADNLFVRSVKITSAEASA